ncbi:hypothetical protein Vafri_1277, partial [Volvox africanus]
QNGRVQLTQKCCPVGQAGGYSAGAGAGAAGTVGTDTAKPAMAALPKNMAPPSSSSSSPSSSSSSSPSRTSSSPKSPSSTSCSSSSASTMLAPSISPCSSCPWPRPWAPICIRMRSPLSSTSNGRRW